MVTDISPIFGMSLVSLCETAVIGSLIGAGVVAGVVFGVNYWSIMQEKRLVSAKLSLKMYEYWEKDKHEDFVDMMERMPDSKVERNDSYLDIYLGIWEEIAVFRNEGTITKNHMKEFFGADLRAIYDNQEVYEYLEEEHTETVYNNLWKLMKKMYGAK